MEFEAIAVATIYALFAVGWKTFENPLIWIPGGEHREAAFMFIDLAGFTARPTHYSKLATKIPVRHLQL